MNTKNITNYKPKDFADLLGVSVKTLQRWDRDSILKAINYVFDMMASKIGDNAYMILFLTLLGSVVVVVNMAGGRYDY